MLLTACGWWTACFCETVLVDRSLRFAVGLVAALPDGILVL